MDVILVLFRTLHGTGCSRNPNGVVLRQPRVERREPSERRATLGRVSRYETQNPKGVALIGRRDSIQSGPRMGTTRSVCIRATPSGFFWY